MNIDLRNIHKHYGPVRANDGIEMTIPSGTLQGILGENGAGKSTLMKILSGFIQADSGEILLDGKPAKIKSPVDAIRHGIGMLHQDPLDFPPMKVIDDFLIGREGGLFPKRAEARRVLVDLEEQFGFSIDPDAYVDTLTVGEKQQLEILRLLSLGVKVLILDEPTTGISSSQREKLFATLRTLAAQGMTVVFVSHKLEEVESLCQRVAVFSKGKLVGEMKPPYVTDDLVKMMFGKVVAMSANRSTPDKAPRLRISDLTIEDYRMTIENVNLDLCKGEIIGIAGMEGSGQRQFLRACAGLVRPVSGKIFIDDTNLTGKPYHNYLHTGVSYVPADRMNEGLITGLTLTDHFILAEEQNAFMINRERAVTVTKERIRDFSIKGVPLSMVDALSGGNQQRALLALLRTPVKLLLMEHPTHGLDIESSIWIWNKLRERCKQGTSILFFSADLEEILNYSNRILVFFGGKISQPLPAETTTVEQLGQLIGGKGF
jgi:general nucleoside transport system ATP-binding protein